MDEDRHFSSNPALEEEIICLKNKKKMLENIYNHIQEEIERTESIRILKLLYFSYRNGLFELDKKCQKMKSKTESVLRKHEIKLYGMFHE